MTTYAELLDRYLGDPGPASLQALRSAIVEAPNFRADLDISETIAPMMAQGDYGAVIGTVRQMMPGAIFSPSAHIALAEAHQASGHQEQARREAYLAQAALDSIVSTGDGTNEAPWIVMRTSDAYDLVLASGKTPRSQVSVGKLERIVCTDSTVWFFDAISVMTQAR